MPPDIFNLAICFSIIQIQHKNVKPIIALLNILSHFSAGRTRCTNLNENTGAGLVCLLFHLPTCHLMCPSPADFFWRLSFIWTPFFLLKVPCSDPYHSCLGEHKQTSCLLTSSILQFNSHPSSSLLTFCVAVVHVGAFFRFFFILYFMKANTQMNGSFTMR